MFNLDPNRTHNNDDDDNSNDFQVISGLYCAMLLTHTCTHTHARTSYILCCSSSPTPPHSFNVFSIQHCSESVQHIERVNFLHANMYECVCVCLCICVQIISLIISFISKTGGRWCNEILSCSNFLWSYLKHLLHSEHLSHCTIVVLRCDTMRCAPNKCTNGKLFDANQLCGCSCVAASMLMAIVIRTWTHKHKHICSDSIDDDHCHDDDDETVTKRQR